jgi:hypothetical protein
LVWLRVRKGAGREGGNESEVSTKCGEISLLDENMLASQEGLRSTDLVS